MSKATNHQKENILVIIKDAQGVEKKRVLGKNIITDAGDIYYTQKVVGEASTLFDTPSMILGTDTVLPTKADVSVTTVIANSDKAVDAGFPQRDNQDAGNPDGDINVVTWKFSYPLGGVIATGVTEGAIVDNGTSPTNALNHFLFQQAFDITDTDQLTVYVNHKFIGV